MAAQGLTAEQIAAAAAGTPTANTPAGGQPPAANPGRTLTQAEIDQIVESSLARDRATREEALIKEFGMPLKDAKAAIAAKKKADDDAKSELEKLTGERDNVKSELEGTKLQLTKMEALLEAGVPSDMVPKLMKRVSGKTPEEIKADIAEMKADGLIPAATPPTAAQGAGNPGVPGTPGKKTWKRSEIKNMSREDHIKNKDEIFAAMRENRITED